MSPSHICGYSTDDPLNPLESFFLRNNLTERQADRFSKYLSACRKTLSINLILWLPTMNQERSRLIRWRLRLLPHGSSYPCPLYPDQFFNSSHSIHCLNIHSRLKIPQTQTSHKKHRSLNLVSPWYIRWSSICSILQETDYLAHSTVPPPLPKPGFLLIE